MSKQLKSLNEKKFKTFLTNLTFFENKPRVAVGVSGGPDSMALIYLLQKWAKIKEAELFGLVFNHSIRNNSKEESLQVKEMLEELNIRTHIIKAKKNKVIKNNMAEARSNRFEGLTSFCKKNNIVHLFLGHHFDDNLETYLIRKINGSNLEGLNCMNEISYFNYIQILRPFIQIKKSQILSFNKKNKVKFIIDPSNININYTRVKVRNFLKNETDRNSVKIDFIKLKKEIPNYKKMIWELLIDSLLRIHSNKIIVSFDKLIKLDDLIIEKHILLILSFFNNKKNPTKSSKITILIRLLKKNSFKIFNLGGIIITKNNNFLIFSKK